MGVWIILQKYLPTEAVANTKEKKPSCFVSFQSSLTSRWMSRDSVVGIATGYGLDE
jgi:hypothetical protein